MGSGSDRLRTTRLILRRWRPDDLEPFAAQNADRETMRYFPAPLTREQSDALVTRFEERFDTYGVGCWALQLIDTGAFIGYTGLNPMPAGVPGAGGWEVAWRLNKAAWGHGYATEAGRAALAVAFGRLGLSEVWSLTATVNLPSRAVMERLGLHHVSTAAHPALPSDSPLSEHVFYQLTRERWVAAAAEKSERDQPGR